MRTGMYRRGTLECNESGTAVTVTILTDVELALQQHHHAVFATKYANHLKAHGTV